MGPLAEGTETGIMDEPMLRAWIHEPGGRRRATPSGRALGGRGRLAARGRRLAHAVLGGDGRLDAAGAGQPLRSRASRRRARRGSWCPYGEVADWPGDQRAMDGMSLTFDVRPASERLEIWATRR